MKVKIEKGILGGEITAPPSKSMAHRLLICAAASDESEVSNVAFSKDITATLNALKALGANVQVNGDKVKIGSLFKGEITPEFSANESGSTLRFLIPICVLSGQKVKISGAKRLFERDLTAYETFFTENNLFFEKGEDYVLVGGEIKAGEFEIDPSLSSQFVSGILFMLSFLKGESVLKLNGKIESRPYIDLTLSALGEFGVKTVFEENLIRVFGGEIKSRDMAVEGDWSNAVFFDALNFLHGGVSVKGLNENSLQGDKVYRKLFSLLGKQPVDVSDCPDLAPILFALAATIGECEFVGTKRLKIKESDRAEAMKEELSKLGVKVQVKDNSVKVFGGEIKPPSDTISAHNDHRIVMAMSVLLTKVGGIIDSAEAVEKSYPNFFEDFFKVANGRIL